MSKLKNTPNDQTLYTLKFNFNYINCSKFKEKELLILRNIVSGSRIGENFYFYKYANISFDESDKKHEYPIVSELDNFGRSKTNGIIFKISISFSFTKTVILISDVEIILMLILAL